MARFSRFGTTMMAAAVVVVLLCRCASGGPSETKKTDTEGALLFNLNDSTTVTIPGEWVGDTLLLHNDQEELALVPLDAGPGLWSIPVFDGTLSLTNDTGHWHDVLRPGEYHVDARWERGRAYEGPEWGEDTLSWALTFGEDDPWFGQLFLQQSQGQCRGSIATATGDFRHLHGTLTGSELILQTFDGAHLFRFAGSLDADGSIRKGVFHSGNHYATPFSGRPVDPSSSSLEDAPIAVWTGQPVQYVGLDLQGDSVRWTAGPSDGVHVLSVMGSWCPNCMDEHRLLVSMMERFPDLRVHTLAFERGLDREGGVDAALARLRRYAEQIGVTRFGDRWRVRLIGPASKVKAQEALPFLDRVVSFPTTIVSSPDQAEPWIHSGFNGPAMGPAHDLEIARFAAAISGLSESR
ncbi:MAG: TlpA family protein disulfide reductase [Flavobacteriales bacterium]